MGIPCIKSSSLALALSSHLHSHGWTPVRVVALAAKHHEHENSQHQYCEKARRAHDVHYDEPVLTRHRIVLVAVQQRAVCRTADSSLRSLDQAETKNPGWTLAPV